MFAVMGVFAVDLAPWVLRLPVFTQDSRFCWICLCIVIWWNFSMRSDLREDEFDFSWEALFETLTRRERLIGTFLKASIFLGVNKPYRYLKLSLMSTSPLAACALKCGWW